uniref:Uncharacterized protein n=1 Tax=Nelumbo nucifera TaxID=4432 RepID=A0A822Y423_NELNU|nr:TPA_asm: hypothetical protein HUJ06_027829 [Nelumbo nucifera]
MLEAFERHLRGFLLQLNAPTLEAFGRHLRGVLSVGFVDVEVLVYNAFQPDSWHPTNFTDIPIK